MPQSIALTAILADDYDKAIAFYLEKLGFELREDIVVSTDKRWVVVGPPGSPAGLLIARAVGNQQHHAIVNQSGGRVFLFTETDDVAHDDAAYQKQGVRFMEEPREESCGVVAVFEDIYGNRSDLIQPANTIK